MKPKQRVFHSPKNIMSDSAPETTSAPQRLAQELAAFHIFKDIPLDDLQLLNVSKPRPVRPGVTLFRQDDIISHIFLVQKGQIELVRTDEHGRRLRRVVGPGQVLGRLELDVTEGQLGTAKTLTMVEFLTLDIASLIRLRARYPQLQSNFDRSAVIGHLRGNPYFAPLSDDEIEWISDIMEVDNLEPGAIIYHQGEKATDIVIIRQGRVRLKAKKKKQRWVSAGSVISYHAVLTGSPRQHSAIVENKTQLFRLPKEDFLEITKLHPKHNWSIPPISVEALLRRAPLFKSLTDEDIQLLAGFVMQIHYHSPHQTIVRTGKTDHYYYVLARGSALKQEFDEDDRLLSSIPIGKGASFGEKSLLFADPAEITVETMEPTDWIRIHRLDFQIYLDVDPSVKTRLFLPPDVKKRLEKRVHHKSWQREDEEILSIRRRHWIVLVKRLSIVFVLLFIQFLIAGIIRLVFGDWFVWQNLVIAALYAVPMTIWIVLDYANDFHIVTNIRIVHEEKIVFIKERRKSAPIEQIQDLSIERDMLAKFLRYGNLVIQTAATEGKIVFDYHPDPNEAHNVILKEMTRLQKYGLPEQQEAIQKQLQERLHLGLEERIDERALMERAHPKKIKQPKNLPFIRLLGLQEQPGHLLVWRRHWFGLILSIIPALLATVASIGILIAILVDALFSNLPGGVQTSLTILSVLAVLVSVFWLWWQWEDWENDRYIVSDQLIQRISKKPLWFDEQRTTLNIERVQNVDFVRPNPLAYLFDFGDVNIQTAAAEGMVTFGFVPAPEDVQFEIFHRIRDYQENMERRRQREEKNDFIEWLEAYHKLVTREQNKNNTH